RSDPDPPPPRSSNVPILPVAGTEVAEDTREEDLVAHIRLEQRHLQFVLQSDPVLRPDLIIIGANRLQVRIGAKWPQREQFKKGRHAESLAEIEIETVGRCD